MKENVLALTIVLADGTIVKTKKRPRKSSAGYNLTGLFIGSEGTLGIVTEITLKLHVKPEHETVAVVNFNDIKDATDSVSDIVSRGIQVNAVEFLDSNMMKCINDVKSTSKVWLEKPTLLIKIGGSKSIVTELVGTIKEITSKNKSIDFQFAVTEDEKEELWSARRQALWSTIDWGKRKFGDDTKVYITDVAVPISRLSKVITETQEDIEKSGFNSTTIGHVGDGNFHALVLYQEKNAKEAKGLVERMVQRALENDGTCTGEHGVGVGKREFLLQELGPEAVDTMRRIKIALDPHRLLNADKIFKIDPSDHNDH
jgi:D-lactate dehydrogenase (cytochrome)